MQLINIQDSLVKAEKCTNGLFVSDLLNLETNGFMN